MPPVLSVKQKILLSLWLTTLLLLGFAGVLASFWFTRDQANRLDDFLSHESRGITEVLGTYFTMRLGGPPPRYSLNNKDFEAFLEDYFQERANVPLPYKTTLAVFDGSGNLVMGTNAALNLALPDLHPKDLELFSVDGPPRFRVAVIPLVQDGRLLGTVRFACLTVSLDEAWQSFLVSLITVLSLVFVSFGLLGTLLIHWSLRPVRQMSESAQNISETHLDLRLAVPPGHDEVAEMAGTLNKLLQQLEQDFEFEEALVGQLSHELRTPLTILRGRNEVALERLVEAEVQGILEDNLADIDSIVSLLNTLLNLARMDRRMDQVERHPCDLALVLQDLIEELEPLWDEKNLNFGLSLPGGSTSWAQCPPLETLGDPTLLRQGFLNILTNAFKYTPRGGQIRLDVAPAGKSEKPQWSLTFRNPGPPIPESSLELVFKRFYRVEIQDPDQYERNAGLGQKGFGLGLSITKSMVELHNGSIRAFNPADGGTAFEVLLPRTAS
jgi:signal transduction histidine kinase